MTSSFCYICVFAILVWTVADSGIQLADDIIKPRKDERLYRGLTLENGIKTVLISDPNVEKAAAALAVRVGFLSDPVNIPGLAHFCEHMLFMGSDKYPEEVYLIKLTVSHGGVTNAETGTDTTDYFFNIGADYLGKSLDVFSRSFIAPRFSESSVDRETNAVNSEYYRGIRDDEMRLDRVFQVIGKPDHSFRKFSVGSRATLYEQPKAMGLEPREEVMKFWENWYSSNIMTLAILGKETLDELQEYADYFSEIENKKIEIPSWESPFVPVTLKKWVDVQTMQQTNDVTFVFPINDTKPLYRSKPQLQIISILGSNGPGSLTAWLKQKGWVQNVKVGSESTATGFGKMSVTITLTNEGENHIQEVGQALFQAIALIRNEGPQKRIFDEQAKLGELRFQNQEQTPGIDLVQGIAKGLFVVPIPEVLEYDSKLYDYKPEEIRMLLEDLNPENMFIIRTSDKFGASQLESKEQYYNISYTVKPIPESMMSTFRDPGENRYFKIPPPNPYIPDCTGLKPGDSINGKVPELIQCDEHFHVWYYQDKEYKVPKGYLWIKLISPMANVDPYHNVMTEMVASLINDALEEPLAAASESGLSYKISSDTMGLTIIVVGYPEKQEELVENILKQIATLYVDPTRLKNINESHVRLYKNFDVIPVMDQASLYFNQLTTEKEWSQEQLLAVFKDVTAERLARFLKQLLSQLHVDIFGSGNYERNDILQIAKITKQILIDDTGTAAVDPETIQMNRRVKLVEGENSLFQRSHQIELNTAFINFYECGEPTTRNNLLVGLIGHIVHPPLFNQLRTIEQLGYYVEASAIEPDGPVGVAVLLSSARDPVYLEKRTESFLAEMTDTLQNMTQEEFEKLKEALATIRFERPKQLATKSSIFWKEISGRQYNFEEKELEKPKLESITLKEFIEMFKKCISPKSNERRRLRVSVVGNEAISNGYKLESACIGEANCVDNPVEFRNTHDLASYPKPFMSLKEIEANCPRNCRSQSPWARYG